jgi:AcrR family transcriptional regulator
MRQKTEAKRQTIINAAAELFKEVGYDRASMSEIADRVGGSKATLYSYFSSKDDLLLAVVTGMAVTASQEMAPQRTSDALAALAPTEHFHAQLERRVMAILSLASGPDMLALRRLVQARGGERGPSQIFFERGPKQLYLRVADFLEQGMKDGHLRQVDPWIAAMHLKGLAESEYIDRLMLGDIVTITPKMIREAALRAIDVFWRAYGLGRA